jgi:hypothetical protein
MFALTFFTGDGKKVSQVSHLCSSKKEAHVKAQGMLDMDAFNLLAIRYEIDTIPDDRHLVGGRELRIASSSRNRSEIARGLTGLAAWIDRRFARRPTVRFDMARAFRRLGDSDVE